MFEHRGDGSVDDHAHQHTADHRTGNHQSGNHQSSDHHHAVDVGHHDAADRRGVGADPPR